MRDLPCVRIVTGQSVHQSLAGNLDHDVPVPEAAVIPSFVTFPIRRRSSSHLAAMAWNFFTRIGLGDDQHPFLRLGQQDFRTASCPARASALREIDLDPDATARGHFRRRRVNPAAPMS